MITLRKSWGISMDVLGIALVLGLAEPSWAVVYVLLEQGGYINPDERGGVIVLMITFSFVRSLVRSKWSV